MLPAECKQAGFFCGMKNPALGLGSLQVPNLILLNFISP